MSSNQTNKIEGVKSSLLIYPYHRLFTVTYQVHLHGESRSRAILSHVYASPIGDSTL